MVGNVYNDLTVLAADGVAPRKARVQCSCGKEFYAIPYEVRTGHTKSCGCRNNRLQALERIGDRFGRLTILSRTKKRKETTYLCECECGETVKALWRNLRSGNTKSCGCLKLENTSGFNHYAALSVEEVERRLSSLAPQYTFPKLHEEWQGVQHTRLTVSCKDHGEFSWGGNAIGNQTSSDLFNGKLCRGCGTEKRQESNGKGVSQPEQDLRDFLDTLTATERGCLPGTQQWAFDVILPEHKIVVEFNGVYWHSFPRANRGQHLYKRKFAEKHGYRMITIWEDHWNRDRSRIEKYFARIIKGAPKRIGARKCRVGSIDRKTADAFHATHHIQSAAPSVANIAYGLFLEGCLVAAVSFDHHGVLHRFTSGEYAVIGGLSRLCSAWFTDHGKDILTFCDRDLFDGQVYKKTGFKKEGYTLQLSYVANKQRVRRERFMKKKLAGLFGEVDMSLTEHEICAQNGIYAAYNSGVDRWVLSAA